MGNAAGDGAGVAPVNSGNGQGGGGSTCWIFVAIGYASLSLQPPTVTELRIRYAGVVPGGTQVNPSCSHRPAAASQSFVPGTPAPSRVQSASGEGEAPTMCQALNHDRRGSDGEAGHPARAELRPRGANHKPKYINRSLPQQGAERLIFLRQSRKASFRGRISPTSLQKICSCKGASSFSSPTGRETPAPMEKKTF